MCTPETSTATRGQVNQAAVWGNMVLGAAHVKPPPFFFLALSHMFLFRVSGNFRSCLEKIYLPLNKWGDNGIYCYLGRRLGLHLPSPA
jgi:hypothetical protein